jgi:hypothetical protein
VDRGSSVSWGCLETFSDFRWVRMLDPDTTLILHSKVLDVGFSGWCGLIYIALLHPPIRKLQAVWTQLLALSNAVERRSFLHDYCFLLLDICFIASKEFAGTACVAQYGIIFRTLKPLYMSRAANHVLSVFAACMCQFAGSPVTLKLRCLMCIAHIDSHALREINEYHGLQTWTCDTYSLARTFMYHTEQSSGSVDTNKPGVQRTYILLCVA